MLNRIATEEIEPPAKAAGLTPALNWMLNPDPQQRPTMGQAQAALTLADTPSTGGPPPPLPVPAGPDPGRRRHRTLGSLVAAVLVIAIAIVLGTTHHGTPTRGAAGTHGPTPPATARQTTGVATTTPSPTSPTTTPATTPVTTTQATATTGATATGHPASVTDQLTSTIIDYYRLVPGDLDSAWTWMTADYQQNHAGGTSGYHAFWANIDKVSLADVTARPPGTVTATITYDYKDGHVDVERTSFGLVQQDGRWKIASSEVLSHHGA
jgi:hypothetical protein